MLGVEGGGLRNKYGPCSRSHSLVGETDKTAGGEGEEAEGTGAGRGWGRKMGYNWIRNQLANLGWYPGMLLTCYLALTKSQFQVHSPVKEVERELTVNKGHVRPIQH